MATIILWVSYYDILFYLWLWVIGSWKAYVSKDVNNHRDLNLPKTWRRSWRRIPGLVPMSYRPCCCYWRQTPQLSWQKRSLCVYPLPSWAHATPQRWSPVPWCSRGRASHRWWAAVTPGCPAWSSCPASPSSAHRSNRRSTLPHLLVSAHSIRCGTIQHRSVRLLMVK